MSRLLAEPTETTVLSYNLWYHKDAAYEVLPRAIEDNNVDILCLQECQPEKLLEKLGGLSLANITPMNPREALATYVNEDRFEVEDYVSCALSRLAFEKLAGKDVDRLQLVKLRDKASESSDDQVVIGNFHAVELLARRRTRRQQAIEAAEYARDFAEGAPVVITGDFNHPFAGHQLINAMRKAGLGPATNGNRRPEHTYRRWLGGEFDRTFASHDSVHVKGFSVLSEAKASDHMPIIARLAINAGHYLIPASPAITAYDAG